MQKSGIYAIVLLLFIMASCGGSSNESESAYEKLLQTADTLQKRNSNLSLTIDTLMKSHESLAQRFQAMDSVDTTWLETLAKHEVAMKTQKATLDKNVTVFEGYNEFRNKRDQVTDAEFEAQISEMKQGHAQIRGQLDQIQSQLKTMSDEHESIHSDLKKMMEEKTEE